jgi:hypothetical protein
MSAYKTLGDLRETTLQLFVVIPNELASGA